jgi:hypothetical protein
MYCKVNTKTRELSILNGTVYSDGTEISQWNLSVHERNLLMQSYIDATTKEIPALKQVTDRKKIFALVSDLQKDCDLLMSLKQANVRSGKDRFSFQSEIYKLIYGKLKKIIPLSILEPDSDNASEIDLIENVILNCNSALVSQELRHEYFISKFDVESEDTSHIDKFESILASYDMSMVDGQVVRETIAPIIKNARDIIKGFLLVKNEAKEELLIWSSQKISRRLNDSGLKDLKWKISHLVERYKRVLKDKGVTVKVTTNESPTKQVMKKWQSKQGVMLQDELMTVLKNVTSSYDVEKILKEMDLNSLKNVIQSDLKSISNKFESNPNGGHNPNFRENVKHFTAEITSKIDKDIDAQTFKTISRFIVDKGTSGQLNWGFITKFEEIVPNDLVQSFISTNPSYSGVSLSDKFFDKHLRGLSMTKKVTSCQTTSIETLWRLSLDERVEYLEVMNKADLKLTRPQFSDLYRKCNWEKVREKIKNKNHLKNIALNLIEEKKDKEMAVHLITTEGDINTADTVKMFDVLDTFEEKLESYLKLSSKDKEGNLNYYGTSSKVHSVIQGVFRRKNDLEKLLENIFDNSLVKDVISVYRVAINEKINIDNINKIILKNISKLKSFDVGTEVIPSMSLELKKALLKEGVELELKNTYYYGGNSVKNPTMDAFFEGLSRADIDETLGGIHNKYTMHLARFMTREELAAIGDKQINFVRANISFFNYGYLQKFKDKKLFKDIVGDRRNHSNSQFANKLLEKLQVTNTVDFFANLDD